MAYELYKIAAAYNNAAGLVNIETIKPAGDTRYFCVPEGYATFDPGTRRTRLNGMLFHAGYPSLIWLFSVLTRKQYEYLRTTYCGGLYSGLVTIASRSDLVAYANYNAILDIPKLADAERHYTVFFDFKATFTHLVAL